MSAGLIVLLAAEVAVIVAAAFGARWLRREGDRAWAAYLRRTSLSRLTAALVRVNVEIRDSFTPAMRKLGRAMARTERAFREAGLR